MSGNRKAVTNIRTSYIESENLHELLRVTIDSKLTFDNHINKLCKKTSQKLNALVYISTYKLLLSWVDLPQQTTKRENNCKA